ncbi:holin [Streptomyces sp. NBC_01384]|uniref:holin n=1 Tax=Streptomyces sp. NBC_01384 TaxID=2903847 RepID=UPI00324EC1D6
MATIEKKVQASTAAGLAIGVLVTVLNAIVGNSQLMGSLPAWLQSLITLVGPPLATFLAGWFAPHTPRVTAAPEPPSGPGVAPAA